MNDGDEATTEVVHKVGGGAAEREKLALRLCAHIERETGMACGAWFLWVLLNHSDSGGIGNGRAAPAAVF